MKSASVSRLQFKRSKRSTLWLAFITGFSLFALGSCGKSERPDIGERLDTPSALASHPTLSVYYVLNASMSGEFETGSLQSYSVPNSASSSSNPRVTLQTPRLGTAIGVARGGEFLIAGFSGTQGQLKVFNLDAGGNPSSSDKPQDAANVTSGRIGSILVNAVEGQTDTWTVVVSVGDPLSSENIAGGDVLLFKYSRAGGLVKLASLPTDFYSPSRENPLGAYLLSWGTPVVFPSLGIAVAFPQGTVNYRSDRNPTALDWLKGNVTLPNVAFDLRTVSAAVVDLNALVAGKGLLQTLGFVPVAFNLNGQKGDAAADLTAEANLTYSFQQKYQSAVAIDPQTSPCQLSGPLSGIAQPAAVVVKKGIDSNIVSLSGWDQVATQLRARLAGNEIQPILGDLLSPTAVSLNSSFANLKDRRTVVPSIHVVNTGSLCTLSWLRVEEGRSSLGREQSLIQAATDGNIASQLTRDLDLTGTSAFTVNGNYVLTSSFSNNKIQVLRFNGAALDNVGVFSP